MGILIKWNSNIVPNSPSNGFSSPEHVQMRNEVFNDKHINIINDGNILSVICFIVKCKLIYVNNTQIKLISLTVI